MKGVLLIDSPCPVGHVALSNAVIEEAARLNVGKSSSELEQLVVRQFRTNSHLLEQYGQSGIKGPFPNVVLLRSSEGFCPPTVTGIPAWLSDRRDGKVVTEDWEQFLGQTIKVFDIPGNHFEVFRPDIVSLCRPSSTTNLMSVQGPVTMQSNERGMCMLRIGSVVARQHRCKISYNSQCSHV